LRSILQLKAQDLAVPLTEREEAQRQAEMIEPRVAPTVLAETEPEELD
jgi:hypothetical protein